MWHVSRSRGNRVQPVVAECISVSATMGKMNGTLTPFFLFLNKYKITTVTNVMKDKMDDTPVPERFRLRTRENYSTFSCFSFLFLVFLFIRSCFPLCYARSELQ